MKFLKAKELSKYLSFAETTLGLKAERGMKLPLQFKVLGSSVL
jgi:hypothetical protein